MLIEMPPTREEWLKLRKKYIGASQSAILLGIGAEAGWHQSLYTLWQECAGHIEVPEVENERADWGNDLEPGIAKHVCREEGWVEQPAVYAVDDTTPGMGSSLDRRIQAVAKDEALGFYGPAPLEIKNLGTEIYYRDWTGGDPAAHVLIQLQHQIACYGSSWGAIGACIGGNRYFCKRYPRHEGIIAAIRQAVTAFWASIEAGTPPSLDNSTSTAQTLKLLYPVVDETKTLDLSDDNELPDLCAKYLSLTEQRKVMKAEVTKIQNQIRDRMGNARYATIAGGFRVSRRIGDDKPARAPDLGEMIPGRKGADTLTISPPKSEQAKERAAA